MTLVLIGVYRNAGPEAIEISCFFGGHGKRPMNPGKISLPSSQNAA
jgi:hypothetical protein